MTLLHTASGKERSSVFLSQKPCIFPGASDVPTQPPLLVRATNGKKRGDGKVKISTLVEPDALTTFFEKFAEVSKSGMTTLKKRDRKARKAKARAKGKREEGAAA